MVLEGPWRWFDGPRGSLEGGCYLWGGGGGGPSGWRSLEGGWRWLRGPVPISRIVCKRNHASWSYRATNAPSETAYSSSSSVANSAAVAPLPAPKIKQ